MRRVAFCLVLLALGGCGAFRASAGIGLGLGGSVKAGPVDVGCLGGIDVGPGTYYGTTGVLIQADVGIPAILRVEGVRAARKAEVTRVGVSGPAALLGYAARGTEHEDVIPCLFGRPTELSFSLYALLVAFHVGFDPGELAREVESLIVRASGGDEPDPPVPLRAAFPVDDSLDEVPFKLVTGDDVAQLDTGTDIERGRAQWRFVREVGDPLALVGAETEDGFERWIGVRESRLAEYLAPGMRAKLVEIRSRERERLFAEASRSRDPYRIADALARFPLAPPSEQADLIAREGELLLEQGEIRAAELAFADEVRRRLEDPKEEGLRAAKDRLAVAQRLAKELVPAPSQGAAWAGSADLPGVRLGSSGRSVWAFTASGDVAWERSDALPAGFSESKVLGAADGLAFLEVQSKNRPWVFALDDEGSEVWRTPLPAAPASGSPMDQFYVLGCGRVFVGRLDRVIALDARSGRLLWMNVRKDVSFEPTDGVPSHAVPLEWRRDAGPPRRRPDGGSGFRIALVGGALEVSGGRGRRTDRFDPMTGENISFE